MTDTRSCSSCGVSVAGKRKRDTDLPKNIGLQILREDGSPNLYALYSGDLGEKILSYASGSDLCRLDALNKQFQGLTVGLWESVTNERYGMKNGKEGWIMGTSLLRKPVFIHINKAPGYGNMYYSGSPKVTTHNSLIAVDTDDGSDDGAPQGVGLYNAQDLSYIGPQEGGGWKTTMAGPTGDETFVTNMLHNLEFRRNGIFRQHRFLNNRNSDGIPVIGCETHVIAAIGNTLNLYRVTPANALLELCQSVLLGRAYQGEDEHFENAIEWGSNKSDVIIYHSVENFEEGILGTYEISVWSFDAQRDSLTRTQTIQAGIKLTSLALAEDFIIGASEDKKLHVWDRHTKEKKSFVLCDVEEDDEIGSVDIIYPLRMSCHGHMLVSTSHLGCALCVWNIKTGQLLKRYNDAEEERRVDMLPDGCDVTSMAYLKDLNGYICADGYLNIWTFPTNQSQKDMALSIRRREQYLRRAAGES